MKKNDHQDGKVFEDNISADTVDSDVDQKDIVGDEANCHIDTDNSVDSEQCECGKLIRNKILKPLVLSPDNCCQLFHHILEKSQR